MTETYWSNELERRHAERTAKESRTPSGRSSRGTPKAVKPIVAKMSPSEAGRLGAMKVLPKYGRQHRVEIGRKGGAALKASRDPDYYSTIGKMGGMARAAKYGGEHVSRMARKSNALQSAKRGKA